MNVKGFLEDLGEIGIFPELRISPDEDYLLLKVCSWEQTIPVEVTDEGVITIGEALEESLVYELLTNLIYEWDDLYPIDKDLVAFMDVCVKHKLLVNKTVYSFT